MDSTQRVEVPCDRDHLSTIAVPATDVAVPSNPAALESLAALLTRQRAS